MTSIRIRHNSDDISHILSDQYIYYNVSVLNYRQTMVCFLFFQAEDGIRDVERSRGLGDVYKRQDYWGI